MKKHQLIGPFTQLLPLSGLPMKGSIPDSELLIIEDGGIICSNGRIIEVGKYEDLLKKSTSDETDHYEISSSCVGLPGFVDAHTHICFAGSRAADYALRNSGQSYLEIAKSGGGIWDTVTKTRSAGLTELTDSVLYRAKELLKKGITTAEVKSGYGLSVSEELKMLRAINEAQKLSPLDIISTCLAAHIFPKDFNGTIEQYLEEIIEGVFPIMKSEHLSNRVDAFIEDGAFDAQVIKLYLEKAQNYNFDITIHADQFHVGGSEIAVNYNAISADHLEASGDHEIEMLSKSNVIATALPGASLGLGMNFTPARKILNSGGALAIASDWNPGSAPMGDLLTQASILGTYEKLSAAEVFAGITFRSAAALNLSDRGKLIKDNLADIISFPTDDYREVLYHQGQLQPTLIWKRGIIQN